MENSSSRWLLSCDDTRDNMKDALEVMELFYILIMVPVTQIYLHVKIHRTVHQKKNSQLFYCDIF